MSVHTGGHCHFVDHIKCTVPILTRHRSKQPHVVMSGNGVVDICETPEGTIAIIKEDV